MHKVIMYRDESNEFRWRRVAENGLVVSDCAEGYQNKADMRSMAKEVNSDCEFVDETDVDDDDVNGEPV